ncbi:vWA domain-containing protein [Kosmotoga pacifica]|uniref:VWFA domain-containing protein n=1 Tax=Kosmotoga pacifica TaxID=1330330 RepID=A0A0G2ZAI9_9BACT|nr:vWA domain-containing protein [Kosmotoga pacifica]AKI97111.1 hypothetical protein IX53_03955 [Kosmotoga pacifica]
MKRILLVFLLLLTIEVIFADEMNTFGFDITDYPSIKAVVRRSGARISMLEVNGLKRNFEVSPINLGTKVVISFLVQEGTDISKVISVDALKAFSDAFSIRPLFNLWSFGEEIKLEVPECNLDFFERNLSQKTSVNTPGLQRLTDAIGFVGASLKEKGDVRFLIVLSDGRDYGSKLDYWETAGILIESGVIPLFLGNWVDNTAPIKILQNIKYGGFYTVQQQDLAEMVDELLTEISTASLMKFQGLGDFKESDIAIEFDSGEKEAFQITVPPWNVRWFLSRSPINDGGVEISFDVAGELVSRQTLLNLKKIGPKKELVFSQNIEYSPGKVFFDSDRLDAGSWLYVVSSHNNYRLVSGITIFSQPPAPKLSMDIPPLTNKRNYYLDFEYQGGILLDSITVGNRTIKMNSPHLKIPIELKKGYNKIDIQYNDIFGRTFHPAPYSIFLDDSPPLLSLADVPQYTSSEEITLKGRVSDNVGLQSLKFGDDIFYLDGKEDYNFSLPATLSSGENVLKIRAEDLAGNVTLNELVITGDFTPPEIHQIHYQQITRNDEVLLYVDMEDNTGIASLKIDGKGYDPSTNVFPAYLKKEGRNEIRVEVVDVAGNLTTKTIDIIRDISPPEIILPDKLIVKAKKVDSSFEVRDDNGVAEVTLNGKLLTESEGKYVFSITLEPGAVKIVKVEAVDRAGNVAEKEIEVIYDIKPAEVQVRPGLSITRKVLFRDDFGLRRLYINGQILEFSGEKEALVDVPLPISQRKILVKVEDIGGNVYETLISAYPWYLSPILLLLLLCIFFFWLGVRVGVRYIVARHQKQHRVKL